MTTNLTLLILPSPPQPLFSPFSRRFGTKCARCSRTISATDWVRRARDLIFHLACFACDSCGRQLSTGEQFALVDDKVLCKTHYSEMFDCGTSSDGKHKGRRKTSRRRDN